VTSVDYALINDMSLISSAMATASEVTLGDWLCPTGDSFNA